MKLIFIYGPPAAGKLTVAHALSRRIGFKVYDNHKTVECLTPLFPFEDPRLNFIRRKLQRSFRLQIFAEAATADLSFITTCAVAGPQHFDFYHETRSVVEAEGGEVLFVRLCPSKTILMQRVVEPSRIGKKIESADRLAGLLANEPELFDIYPDVVHLSLDNSNLDADESAKRIADYYSLSELV